MAAASQAGAKTGAQGSDEKLVLVLEETATHKILEKLDGVLPEIAREAVREAIVHAIHAEGVSVPKRRTARSQTPGDVKRPREGGRCDAVWKELDKLQAKKDAVPKLADIQKVGERRSWNPNNTRVEYYQWRKAKGISGRVDPGKPSNQPHAA